MALQLIQIGFGLGIVAAYAALQFGRVGEHDLSYLATNLVSAGGLTATAVVTVQPGFVVSGGFWTSFRRPVFSRGAPTPRITAGLSRERWRSQERLPEPGEHREVGVKPDALRELPACVSR